MPGGRDGPSEQGTTHGVVERPGLRGRGRIVAVVAVVVIGVALAARATDRAGDRSAPTTVAPTTAPSTAATATTRTTKSDGTDTATPPGPARTAPPRRWDLAVTPADLPCPVVASHPAGPPDHAFSAPTPEPDALIPRSASYLSWDDPDLDVHVVPGSDVAVLTATATTPTTTATTGTAGTTAATAVGTRERRTVGTVDPATGAWHESFTQDGCWLQDAVVVDDRPPVPPHLWLLLGVADADPAGEGFASYLADVALDTGTVAWSARADHATTVIAAVDGVWVLADPVEHDGAGFGETSWSGHNELFAVDPTAHVVRGPIAFDGAVIRPWGLVSRHGVVVQVDFDTGESTEPFARLPDRHDGEPGDQQVLDDLLDTRWGFVAVEDRGAVVSRRDLRRVGAAPADATARTLWTSPCDHGIRGPTATPRLHDAWGLNAIAFVTVCDDEAQVHVLDGDGNELAPDLSFPAYDPALEGPLSDLPELSFDRSGFWYVARLARTGARHLLHVEVAPGPAPVLE